MMSYPAQSELDRFTADMTQHRRIKYQISNQIKCLPEHGHPMDALQATVAALGMFYPARNVVDRQVQYWSTIRLIAKVTTTGPELSCKDIVAMGSEPAGHDLRTVARGATRQAERARILQALQQTGSNRAKAAKLLKISRASLYNKLRTYGMCDA